MSEVKYKVLIVDDEIDAVRGIKASVNWESLDIAEVYSSYNIRQAKQIILSNNIDIMICDIEMPQGNGIELLEWIREKHPEIISILLTCHADFQYAQKALRLGAFNYLLKPANSKDLKETLQKSIQLINKKRKIKKSADSYNHYYQLWSANKPRLTERFWLSLLDGTIPSDAHEIEKAFKEYDISIEYHTLYFPIVLTVLQLNKSNDVKKNEHEIKEIAQAIIGSEKDEGIVLALKEGVLLALVRDENTLQSNRQKLIKICLDLIEQSASDSDCDVTCYVGEKSGLLSISGMVDKLIQMSASHIPTRRKFFFIDEQHDENMAFIPQMHRWADFFIYNEKDAIYTELGNFFDSISKLDVLHIEVLNDFYRNFIQVIYTVLQKKSMQANKIFLPAELDKGIAATRALAEFKEWVYSIVEKLSDNISQKPFTIVEKTKDYILKNIGDKLTREDISNFVHINQDYLSRLFKKETGMSISSYIIQEKIKVAKEMLINTETPVSKIGSDLGYSNFSHFSKTFKKVTGEKPLEYRNKKNI